MEVSGKQSLSTVNRCEDHGLELQSFCPVHKDVCCRDCVARHHTGCGKIITLGEAADAFSDAASSGEVNAKLESLLEKFELARKGERESLRSVDVQGRELEKRVRKFRDNINKMLDKIETTMVLKKDEICNEERSVLKKRIDVCDVAINNLQEAMTRAKSLGKGVSKERSLITMCKLQTMNDKYLQVHDEIVDGKGTFAINFIPNGELVQALDSLGSLNVRSTIKPTQIQNVPEYDVRLVKTGEIDVSSELDNTMSTITGCVYMDNNQLILADESNCCLKRIPDGKSSVDLVHDLSYAPWDIAALNEKEIVVRASSSTSDADNVLYMYTVRDTIQHLRTINLNGRPRAIDCNNNMIFVAVCKGQEFNITTIDKDGKVKKNVPQKNVIKDPQYISVQASRDRLYVSDFNQGILALTLTGTVVFKKAKSELREFGGTAIDKNGDVFVCAGRPYGIYRVCSEGFSMVPFITWEDGDVDPQALAFCEKNDTFLVTCCNSNKAFMYAYV